MVTLEKYDLFLLEKIKTKEFQKIQNKSHIVWIKYRKVSEKLKSLYSKSKTNITFYALEKECKELNEVSKKFSDEIMNFFKVWEAEFKILNNI